MWLFFLFFLVLFEALADIIVKEWTIRSAWTFAVGAICMYIIANIFWLFAMKYGVGLGRGAVLFSILSALFGVIIGVFMYKESTNNLQLLGLLFGLVSITFFALGER